MDRQRTRISDGVKQWHPRDVPKKFPFATANIEASQMTIGDLLASSTDLIGDDTMEDVINELSVAIPVNETAVIGTFSKETTTIVDDD